MTGALQGDAEIELGLRIIRLERDGAGEKFDRFHECIGTQALNALLPQRGRRICLVRRGSGDAPRT